MSKLSLPIPDEVLQDLLIECPSLDQLTAQNNYPIPEDQLDKAETSTINATLLVLSSFHHQFQKAASKILQGSGKAPWIDSFLDSDLAKHPRLLPTAQALDRLVTGKMDNSQLWVGASVFFWTVRHNWNAEICTKLTDSCRDYLDKEYRESDWQIKLQTRLALYTRYLRWRTIMYNQVADLILQDESGQVVTQHDYSEALLRAKYVDQKALEYLQSGAGSGMASALYDHVGRRLQNASRNSKSTKSDTVPDGLRLLFAVSCGKTLPDCMAQYDVVSLLGQ